MANSQIRNNESIGLDFGFGFNVENDDHSEASFGGVSVNHSDNHIAFTDDGWDHGSMVSDLDNFSQNDSLRSVNEQPAGRLVRQSDHNLGGYRLKWVKDNPSDFTAQLKAIGSAIGNAIGSALTGFDNLCGNFFTKTIPDACRSAKESISNKLDKWFGQTTPTANPGTKKFSNSDLQSLQDLQNEVVEQSLEFKSKQSVNNTAHHFAEHMLKNRGQTFNHRVTDGIAQTTLTVRDYVRATSDGVEMSSSDFRSEMLHRFRDNRHIQTEAKRTGGLISVDIEGQFDKKVGPLFDLLVNSYELAESAQPGTVNKLQWDTTVALLASTSDKPQECMKTIEDVITTEQARANSIIESLPEIE